jgi:hypothetical protein
MLLCLFCRLLVNLVTSVTLGLALAAEPAEPTVMARPPRRPNKRLLGKLILWRCFFVCHLVVILVLGMFEWALKTGRTLGQGRAEAFNVLVGAQVVYFITCRWVMTPQRCPTQTADADHCVLCCRCLSHGRHRGSSSSSNFQPLHHPPSHGLGMCQHLCRARQ